MTTICRAMQATRWGRLNPVERPVSSPAAAEVLIAVEACGICGADASDIERADPAADPPQVPEHEMVGRIVSHGAAVPSNWRLGQRDEVGRLGGPCTKGRECRRGRFRLCCNRPVMGSSCDGGDAEMMLVRAAGLVSIPDELSSEEAAPILCDGLATFNGLKKSRAEAGDTVSIPGIGGLGYMALQYTRRVGFRVVALERGQDIAADTLVYQ